MPTDLAARTNSQVARGLNVLSGIWLFFLMSLVPGRPERLVPRRAPA